MKTLLRTVSLLVITAMAGGSSTSRFDGGGPPPCIPTSGNTCPMGGLFSM